MNAAAAITRARLRSQLSKRELARRARTSPAAIVQYESGAREPTLPTLERIIDAAGSRAELDIVPTLMSRAEHARRLAQVIEFAELIPRRRPPARHLEYPLLRG